MYKTEINMSSLSRLETKTENGMRSRRRTTSALGSKCAQMVVFHLSCFAVLYEASAFSPSNIRRRTTTTTSHRRSAFIPSNPWSTGHRSLLSSSSTSLSRRTLYRGNGLISGQASKALLAQTDASAKTTTSSDEKKSVSKVDPLQGSPPVSVTLEGEDYSYSDAIQRTLGWVGAAIVFGGGVWALAGSATGEEFFAGYLVEQSLSVDNLFVFLLLFQYFKVPLQYQDRVLNWGIYGAVVMRAVMIGIGAAALKNFRAILLVFAAILVYSSANALFGGDAEDEDPSQNSIVKFSRSLINSTDDFDGDRFFTLVDGVRQATPLFICMIAVEISDVVFAVDSIPAVFGVTEVSRFIDFFPWMIDSKYSSTYRIPMSLHAAHLVRLALSHHHRIPWWSFRPIFLPLWDCGVSTRFCPRRRRTSSTWSLQSHSCWVSLEER
jgi:predicted tellurium resistance membrane protein TerC